MNSPPERPDPDLHQTLRELSAACERIAASLGNLEQLYAGEVKANEKQRAEVEAEKIRWQEEQKKWDQDPARQAQKKEYDEKMQALEKASIRFYDSLKPAGWQVQLFWIVVAIILLGLLKASVRYLFGYWPTS